MMNTTTMVPFDPTGWQAFLPFTVSEPAGIARQRAVVDVAFALPGAALAPEGADLRVVHDHAGQLRELTAQFYNLEQADGNITGRVAFFLDIAAGASESLRLYHGNPGAKPPSYPSSLTVMKAAAGPQHYWIENEFYKIETLPKSGQIWHVWNKRGSNTSWHHNEWAENTDKGGDPCHWAPNCWVGYPDRVTNGYELREGKEPDFFDWHYVFGWDNPSSATIRGPVFFELRRWGPVWPHPEHTNANIRRDDKQRIVAEVVYRFYAGLPWLYQSSRLQTLEDLRVFFIRNSQFVFLDRAFTHALLMPERRPDILPTDEVAPAVIRLMARDNLKPFPRMQHSLSNVLPAKLEYVGFYNSHNGDAFTEFQLVERNGNVHSGAPTYRNHTTLLTELHDWSVYFGRAFSYTNLRFHPENATFLPKGERYEEENICLIHRHENLPATLADLAARNLELRNPLEVKMPT
ncbi:MAG: hypothetical protein PHU85_10880 [Phycisphaerae bacterium]|nr:hypothetical protein [Phycisphaerae bacterium]